MVIFPFEETFYRNRQVNAIFAGHPLAELPLPATSREDYAIEVAKIDQKHWQYSTGIVNWPNLDPLHDWAKPDQEGRIKYQLDIEKPWIALLPGSRIGEVMSNLWDMVEAAYLLGDDFEFLIPIAQTITQKQLEQITYALGDGMLQKPNPPRITLVPDAREALHHARASIVASGTATVQAAVIGNPFLVVYKVSPLTFRLAKRLVHYPPEIWSAGLDAQGNLPIAMVNLIAGRRIVPELIQDNFTAANVAQALRPLLDDTPQRTQMISDLADLRKKLLPPAGTSSIAQVADAVDALLLQPASVLL
jgi:lipid-A-disaccharide synthase